VGGFSLGWHVLDHSLGQANNLFGCLKERSSIRFTWITNSLKTYAVVINDETIQMGIVQQPHPLLVFPQSALDDTNRLKQVHFDFRVSRADEDFPQGGAGSMHRPKPPGFAIGVDSER
jgi:hypothetical protein